MSLLFIFIVKARQYLPNCDAGKKRKYFFSLSRSPDGGRHLKTTNFISLTSPIQDFSTHGMTENNIGNSKTVDKSKSLGPSQVSETYLVLSVLSVKIITQGIC